MFKTIIPVVDTAAGVCEVKVNLSLCAPCSHVGNEAIAPLLLNLDTRWKLVVKFTPLGESTLNRRLGGVQTGLGNTEKITQFFSLSEIKTQFLGIPTCSVVTLPTELSRS
jgi:hypothetical protein